MALSVEDHIAIQQLYARYAHAWVAGDGVQWASCWTSDGEFNSPTWKVVGAAGLAELAANRKRSRGYHPWINHLVLDEAPIGVVGRCFAVIVDSSTQPPSLQGSYIYHDVIVQEDGAWKFRRRDLVFDHAD